MFIGIGITLVNTGAARGELIVVGPGGAGSPIGLLLALTVDS